MRARIASGVLGVLLVLMPRAASAELGFFRWWDSLSGPGPFSGVVVDPVFLCYATKRVPPDTGPSLYFDPGCHNAERGRVRISVGLTFARLDGRNNLPYDPPRQPPEVHAYPLMITASASRHPVLELGGAIGVVRFSGDGFGFTRFAIEPRVTVRPLVLLRRGDSVARRRLEILQIRLLGTGIPGSMTAADFGATGPFRSDAEWLPGFMVIADLTRLRWGAAR